MKTDNGIEPYLKYYIGHDAETIHRHYPDPSKKSVRKTGKMMDYDLVIDQVGVWFPGEEKENLVNFKPNDLKPMLRKLSSMTREEEREVGGNPVVSVPTTGKRRKVILPLSPDQTHYLLSSGFDLFGLIDAGLAVEKKP
jgi:hypothetical protein